MKMASFRVGVIIFQTFVIAYKIKTLLGAQIIENIDSNNFAKYLSPAAVSN